MATQMIIQRKSDQKISLDEWVEVARRFPQIRITNKSTKGHPYEGMAEWIRDGADEAVMFQPYVGDIHVSGAIEPEDPLVLAIAEALNATVATYDVGDDPDFSNVRLEFPEPHDFADLLDLSDILNEKLEASGVGEIIGEGLEQGFSSKVSDLSAALRDMRRQEEERDGDRFRLVALVLHVESDDIEAAMTLLQSALPGTTVPPGTRVLLENENGDAEFRFTV